MVDSICDMDSEHSPLASAIPGGETPPEVKLRRRWEAIPIDVAESMAFEGEPVAQDQIRAILARIEPPALLKRPVASLATRS